MTFQDWAEQYSQMMVAESMKLIEGSSKRFGDEATRYLTAKYLEKYVALVLYKELRTNPILSTSQKDREEFVIKRVGDMKLQIQESVAAGFQQAMTAFSGQIMDYYCQIKPVPAMISTKVN